MVDAFSLKLQRNNRKNALTVDPATGKTEKSSIFYRTVEMKQPHTLTEPLLFLAIAGKPCLPQCGPCPFLRCCRHFARCPHDLPLEQAPVGGIRLFDGFLKIHFEFHILNILRSLQKWIAPCGAASPFDESLGRGGGGAWGGGGEALHQKGSPPPPQFFPLLDYMKISLYKTIRSS